MLEIRRLDATEGLKHIDALAEVLKDCVDGGASVSFMPPFPQTEAVDFFDKVVKDVEAGGRILLAAFDGPQLVGTVQVIIALPPNQPHRGDVTKLLVLRSARRQGIAEKLMQHAEEVSKQAGKTLLVLDTCYGTSAHRLYTRMGWKEVGIVPKFALNPDGSWCDTTFFYKQLA